MNCFRIIPTCSDPGKRREVGPRATRRVLLGLFFAGLVGMVGAAPALADAVDDAKAAGLVGENPDGYLGAVPPNPPADIVKLVTQTNAKRKEAYAEIAAQTGTTPEAVAAIAAQKLYAKAPPGTYLMGADGTWQQK